MTFNQIVWKMARAEYRKYLFYYLCNSFAVLFFFMFSTVYFNSTIERGKKMDGIQDALSIPGVALIVFTIFFISYAHNVFMKKRRSEFGLFMALGLSKRDICRLLLLENGVVGLAGIVSGLMAGAVFSRLFFMLLMGLVGIEAIPFHFSVKMFGYTIGAFLIVFLLALGKSLFQTLRNSTILSIKSSRVSETIKSRSAILGSFGVLLMSGSLLTLYYTYEESAGGYLPLWTMVMLIGLYISLNQFTSFLIHAIKKSPRFYYRRLLFLTSIDHKFKQLTSIIMLVTVMVMITIFYSTLLLTFYKSSEKDALANNPYDVAFFQTETKNLIQEEELDSIFDVKEHRKLPIFYHYQRLEYIEGYQPFAFMFLDDFNKLTSEKMELADDEFLFYLNSNPEYANPDVAKEISFSTGNEEMEYRLKDKVVKMEINLLPNSYEFIVVNGNQFDLLRDSLEGYESSLHLINVSDWKSSGVEVEELKEMFTAGNQATPRIEDPRTEFAPEEEIFRVASKVEAYHHNRNANGLMFFVTTFLSIMFFVGTFVLLYLNLFAEIEVEKAKYRKLYKIGVTSKEVKANISKELRTIFFIPSLIGITLALLYIAILSTDVGGIMKNPELLHHFIFIAGIYLVIQTGSFFYARRKMFIQLM